MNIKCLLITSENRGDHAADVYKVYDILPNETVEGLIKRCGMLWPTESIELKIVDESHIELGSNIV